MTDHPDTDLTDPHGETEALRRENERLRAELASSSFCKEAAIAALMARVEAAEAARDTALARIANLEAQLAALTPPPDAELDALVKRLRAMSNHPESAYAEAAAAITALRSRPVGVTDKMINAAFDALPSDACGTIATGEMERVLEAALAAGRGRYDVGREWAQIKLSLDDGVTPAAGCGDRLGIALLMIANGVANPAQVAREAMSAITALRAKAEVKVKPLVWRMEYGYTGRAETSIGVYLIERFPGQGQPYRLINAFDGKSSHSTLEAAKAAAQADYDARIRAALEGGE